MYIYEQCNNNKNNNSCGNNRSDDKNRKEFGFENRNTHIIYHCPENQNLFLQK